MSTPNTPRSSQYPDAITAINASGASEISRDLAIGRLTSVGNCVYQLVSRAAGSSNENTRQNDRYALDLIIGPTTEADLKTGVVVSCTEGCPGTAIKPDGKFSDSTCVILSQLKA